MTFEEMIEKDGFLAYTCHGISMLPLLRAEKDVVVIEKIRRPLRKYDAVLFRREEDADEGKYVLHRILRVYGDGSYFIIGDNCYNGEIVREENILGILTSIRRGERTIRCEGNFPYALSVRIWRMLFPIRRIREPLRRAGSCVKRRILRIR